MKAQRQSLDRISALPQETIEKILTHMPIRDALRTSILSRKWRYSWTGMPKLVFDGNMVVYSGNEDIYTYKFVNAILHVLLLHKAPILEFSLFVSSDFSSEIDQIILHLSRSHNVKKLIFNISVETYYLPCSFFSLQGLEHLDLSYCSFERILMNKGFSVLKSLRFYGVTEEMLILEFLTICPALEKFTWISDTGIEIELTEDDFVELFKCLTSVQVLEISQLHIKPLAAGSSMPHKLPISLPNLRILDLAVCFPELSAVLCVICSSPNLEKFKLEMYWDNNGSCDGQPFENLLDLQDYTGLYLDHLKEMEIKGFRDCVSCIEFVKLVMAKSPMLNKAQIHTAL